MIINISISYHIGGAWVFAQRLAQALPQYTWTFTKTPDPKATICIYMNDHQHYVKAKALNIPHIIQRKTGARSLATPEPRDLDAVICGSQASYNNSTHKNKVLIYNGIDLDHMAKIKSRPNIDWLVGEQRIGVGQGVERSIKYAIKHGHHLTILGNGDGIANDNTYKNLKKKYPQCSWIGRVDSDTALSYIKSCNAILISNKSHGVAQQSIEALVANKKIIDLTPNKILEIPPRDQLDIKLTAQKYDELFKRILGD